MDIYVVSTHSYIIWFIFFYNCFRRKKTHGSNKPIYPNDFSHIYNYISMSLPIVYT
ncbi:hypothetical protein Hanom_Chr03g00275251 [Helianthus anomalus]